jgi:hypothetical protein
MIYSRRNFIWSTTMACVGLLDQQGICNGIFVGEEVQQMLKKF